MGNKVRLRGRPWTHEDLKIISAVDGLTSSLVQIFDRPQGEFLRVHLDEEYVEILKMGATGMMDYEEYYTLPSHPSLLIPILIEDGHPGLAEGIRVWKQRSGNRWACPWPVSRNPGEPHTQ